MRYSPLLAAQGVARGSIDPSLGNDLSTCLHAGKCVAEKSADLFRVCLNTHMSLTFHNQSLLNFFQSRSA
jgi:hypothetical protein